MAYEGDFKVRRQELIKPVGRWFDPVSPSCGMTKLMPNNGIESTIESLAPGGTFRLDLLHQCRVSFSLGWQHSQAVLAPIGRQESNVGRKVCDGRHTVRVKYIELMAGLGSSFSAYPGLTSWAIDLPPLRGCGVVVRFARFARKSARSALRG